MGDSPSKPRPVLGGIQPKFPSYAEGRKFIWDEFRSLVDFAEAQGVHPFDFVVSEALGRIDAEHVKNAWTKALERRSLDPRELSPWFELS